MKPAADTVNLVEVFSSIQGEGLYVGCRQVFVRLAGCNIFCQYCDTTNSFCVPEYAKIEQEPGRRNFMAIANPVPVAKLIELVSNLCRSPHHSVSVTGGEPLLQPETVSAFGSLREQGIGLYLETNGTLPRALEQVIDQVDIISLDFKLPSAMKGKEYWQQHEQFLLTAVRREPFVKVVLSAETTSEEILRSIDLIEVVDSTVPLIFQPVTPTNGVHAVDPQKVLLWQQLALHRLKDVRVIPQTHKIMGQL